ncbi:MAG: hypothetical protein ACYS1A_00720 [Planctomycetota bacterium]|jgi:hypothetical protein
MKKKSGNFFEEHVEKMVLVVVFIVSMWLLVTRVMLSPNRAEYDGEKLRTSQIDIRISEQAEQVEDRLNRKPQPKQTYESQFDKFFAKVNSAIDNIDTSIYLRQPILSSRNVAAEGIYNIPAVGGLDDVGVEHIRAVAYVPIVEVDEQNPYNQAGSEPNDLDFVTVEAKLDIVRLCESFHESFAGEDVKQQWRDPCLGVPIFAAVELQRQEQIAEDSWSEWQIVPRTKIDPRKKMFEVIEDVVDLPAGGMKVRLLQFDVPDVRMDLLQPEAYMIASAKEEWFPPSLHKEFAKRQKDDAAQERRQAREAEMAEREEERERKREERASRRTARTTTTTSTTSGAMGDSYESMMEMMMGGGPSPSTTRTQQRRTQGDRRGGRNRSERTRRGGRRGRESDRERSQSTGDKKKEKSIYDKFDAILLSEKGRFAEMREPFVFWAYDDTVEPEKTYRYKIRLGVFNPIAGTDQFSEQDKSFQDKVVLWSNFSDVTGEVTIPAKLYFFPLDIQEAVKTVKVAVARYMLGYWYSEEFMVKRGEVIGKVMDTKIEEEQEDEDSAVEEGVILPETIDYSTGAVLVDVKGPINGWLGGKNLRPRQYYDMLYSFDGTDIEHIPVESRHWAKPLLVKFDEIKRFEKEPKTAWRPWGSRAGRRGRTLGPIGPAGPGGPEGGADDYMRMLEQMMQDATY